MLNSCRASDERRYMFFIILVATFSADLREFICIFCCALEIILRLLAKLFTFEAFGLAQVDHALSDLLLPLSQFCSLGAVRITATMMMVVSVHSLTLLIEITLEALLMMLVMALGGTVQEQVLQRLRRGRFECLLRPALEVHLLLLGHYAGMFQCNTGRALARQSLLHGLQLLVRRRQVMLHLYDMRRAITASLNARKQELLLLQLIAYFVAALEQLVNTLIALSTQNQSMITDRSTLLVALARAQRHAADLMVRLDTEREDTRPVRRLVNHV